MMNEVGQHLQTTALSQPAPLRDQFARSAYNRYYYANFLAAREMYQRLYPDSENLGHADYPNVLRGKVLRVFKGALTKARKIGDYKLSTEIERAKAACLSLADQFEKANTIRKIADYEPEVKVVFNSKDRFSLSSITITEAHQWIETTNSLIDKIENTWNRVNVI